MSPPLTTRKLPHAILQQYPLTAVLQHIKLLSGSPDQDAASPGKTSSRTCQPSLGSGDVDPGSSSAAPTNACSSSSGSSKSGTWSRVQRGLLQPAQLQLSSEAPHPAPAGLLQLELQQWRCITADATAVTEPDLFAPARGQAASYALGPGSNRSQLENSILLSPSVSKLAELLQHASDPVSAREALSALNRLSKLNKVHRTTLKQEVRACQQQWQSLRPLDAQQEQQLQVLQQRHAQHEQELQAVLTQLVVTLSQEHSRLHVEQVMQILGCLGSLGCVHHIPGGHNLLLEVLQRLNTGLAALQPRHYAFIATALAQVREIEHGTAADDDMQSPDEATQDSSSPGSVHPQLQLKQQQQEVQLAVAEMSQRLVLSLCAAVQQCGSLMDATSLANFAAAMARLGHYDWQTMQHLGGLVARQAQFFNAGQVAKVLVGFTKLRHFDSELCARLADAAEHTMAQAGGVQIVQIAWALAHQRCEQPGVFEAAARQAPMCMAELQPRHVTNMAWAYAVRKAYSPSLYDALGGRMVQLLSADRATNTSSNTAAVDSLFINKNDLVLPHHLSLVAWSFAKQGHKHEQMMGAIADRVVQVADQMLPQNVSNTAWAFGRLGQQHPAMFKALSAAAKATKLEGYNNQNITDLAWGFAEAGNQDPELFELVASATSRTLLELSPHSLSDLVWAFATARDSQAAKVLAKAAPAAINCLNRFSVGMVADLLWSYSAVGVKDDALLAAAAQVLPVRLAQLEHDTESQAKIIWSMQQLGWRDPSLERHLSTIVPGLTELLGS